MQQNTRTRLPICLILVQTYSLSRSGRLPYSLRLFQRNFDIVPSTVFMTSFTLVLSPLGNTFTLLFLFPLQGMLVILLFSFPLQGIPLPLSRINAPFRSLYASSPRLSTQSKPFRKKPITLLFIFSQLININLLRCLGSTGGNRLITLGEVNLILSVQLCFSSWDERPLGLSLRGSSKPRWLILYFSSWTN